MSSYRRFISYMHQYPNGKKGINCGFIKIEIKNNICSLWFQLKKVPSADTVSISFFIRENDTVTLVPIWKGNCPKGIFHQHLTTDSLHLFNTNYSFRQCAGIILSQENHVICGSCWDMDGAVPVDLPDAVVDIKSTTRSESFKDGISNNISATIQDNAIQDNAIQNIEKTSKPNTLYTDTESLIKQSKDQSPKTTMHLSADINSETAHHLGAESSFTSDKSSNPDNTPAMNSAPFENNVKISSKTNSESASNTHIGTDSQTTSDATSNDSSDTSSGEKDEEPKEPPTFEELWNSMQKKYPPLDPFEEGGIVEGIKISPSDLPYLQCLPFDLGANRFLLHGYKNYKHLLLGRMEGQNRYILGIPGVFDSQEQFMAKMFGFPCFKPIRSCIKPVGQFGYWFRCIHS